MMYWPRRWCRCFEWSTQYWSSSCPLNTNMSTTCNTVAAKEVPINQHTIQTAHRCVDFLMMMMIIIIIIIKSEIPWHSYGHSCYLEIGDFGMLPKLCSNLWAQICKCGDLLQVVAVHNSRQCSTGLSEEVHRSSMSLLQSSWTASCLCYTEVLDESCHSPNRFQSTLKHILHTSKLQKSPLRMDLVLLCTHRICQAQTDLPSLCIPAKTKECKRGRTLHRSSSSAGYMRWWPNTSFTRRRRRRNSPGSLVRFFSTEILKTRWWYCSDGFSSAVREEITYTREKVG